MVGDEAHQIELVQQPEHGVAVAHQQAVHPVARHQPQRLEEVRVGVDLDQAEAGHLADRQLGRGLGTQQRIAQVGGGEDAQAMAVPHQRVAQPLLRQHPAHRHQVEPAIDVAGLAHMGVAHARSEEREHLALGFDCAQFRHGAGHKK